MPEYDAFGREIGADTLSGLGDSTLQPQPAPQRTPQPAPRVEDEPAPAPPGEPAFAPPPLRQPRRRRGRGLGCLIGLVVLVAVVAGPVIALVSIVGDATDVVESVTDAIDDGVVAQAPPQGIEGESMVREANFATALRRIAAEDLGRAMSIRLSPDRVSMQMVKRGTIRPGVTYDHRGELDTGPSADVGGDPPALALDRVDPAAPVRLVRASAERFPTLTPQRLEYVFATANPIEGGFAWRAYYAGRGSVAGDARGRVVRRFKP